MRAASTGTSRQSATKIAICAGLVDSLGGGDGSLGAACEACHSAYSPFGSIESSVGLGIYPNSFSRSM